MARIDKEYDIALQAWMNNQATATKTTGSGKNQKTESIYMEFKDFFDYEKKIQELDGPSLITEKEQRMARIAASVNSKGG